MQERRTCLASLSLQTPSRVGSAPVGDRRRGRTDIAFGSRRLWKVSLGRRGPLQALRNGAGFTPVNRLPLGHFDAGSPRPGVGFDGSSLFRWHGLGNGNSFRLLSRQPMS
jgi:hypothetical protein